MVISDHRLGLRNPAGGCIYLRNKTDDKILMLQVIQKILLDDRFMMSFFEVLIIFLLPPRAS